MKILVIDDDEMMLKILNNKLSKNGHDVTTAHQADEALNMMSKDKPDLVISDMMMPNIDGLAFLSMINAEYLSGVKVMMMSSLVNDEVINLSMNLGAVDYIMKPIDFYQLIPKIDRLAN